MTIQMDASCLCWFFLVSRCDSTRYLFTLFSWWSHSFLFLKCGLYEFSICLSGIQQFKSSHETFWISEMSSQSSKMCRKSRSDWINCSNLSKGYCSWWHCHFWTWGPFSWRCEAVIFKTPCCKVCYLEIFLLSVDEDF